jgi:hypothetical protein
VQVDGDAATLTAISKTSEVMERVLLHQPVAPDPVIARLAPTRQLPIPPVEADDEFFPDDDSPSELMNAHQPVVPEGSEPTSGSLPQKAPGLVAFMWTSGLALLAGLLILTRPAPRKRRADLQPGARRRNRYSQG